MLMTQCRVSFELEAGAVGQTTDFKEGNRRLEWCFKKVRIILISVLGGLAFKTLET